MEGTPAAVDLECTSKEVVYTGSTLHWKCTAMTWFESEMHSSCSVTSCSVPAGHLQGTAKSAVGTANALQSAVP